MIETIILLIGAVGLFWWGWNYFSSAWEESQFETAIHGSSVQRFWPAGLAFSVGLLLATIPFDLERWALWAISVLGVLFYTLTVYENHVDIRWWKGKREDYLNVDGDEGLVWKQRLKKKRKAFHISLGILAAFFLLTFILIVT